jgi:hypothetical protein
MTKAIHNERIRYLSASMNTSAIATWVLAGIVPVLPTTAPISPYYGWVGVVLGSIFWAVGWSLCSRLVGHEGEAAQ